MKSQMRIKDYYAGKHILISGATGLVGKALVEKLLRSCPDVAKIYVIIRPKRGLTPEERWKKTTDSYLFNYLRESHPESLKKCQVLYGENSADNLGLSKEHLKLIEENVNIIYHVAASISFEDDLVTAIKLNLKSTYSLLEVAKTTKKLECFVYVSTAFSNFNKGGLIEEKVYKSHLGWRELIQLADDPDNFEQLCALQLKVLNGHISTYTLTKGLAEDAVNDYREHFPIVINRPALILGSYKDPTRGWMDVDNILSLFGKGWRMGVVRVLLNDAKNEMQQVPLDLPIKALIVAPWKKHVQSQKNVEVHCCKLNTKKMLTNGMFYGEGAAACRNYPTKDMLWHPFLIHTTNYTVYYVLFILLHFIPAVFVDGLLKLSGKRPKLMRVYQKYWNFTRFLKYDLKSTLQLSTTEFMNLENYLLEEDKTDFSMDVSDYDPVVVMGDLVNCMILHMPGWKASKEELAQAHAIARKFKILHYAVCSAGALVVARILLYIAL